MEWICNQSLGQLKLGNSNCSQIPSLLKAMDSDEHSESNWWT